MSMASKRTAKPKAAKDVGKVLLNNRKVFRDLLMNESLKSAFIQRGVFPQATIEELFMDTLSQTKRRAKLFKAVQGIVNSTTTVQRKKFSRFLKAVRQANCDHVADALEKAFNDNGHGSFVTGQFPKDQKCGCKAGRCSTNRCSCRKDGRRCRPPACRCSSGLCENLEDEGASDAEEEEEDDAHVKADDESASSVRSTPESDRDKPSTSSGGGVSMVCQQGNCYSPDIHEAMWHNEKPFVLRTFTRKLKKCCGCATRFSDNRNPDPKFVISHEEQVEFWTGRGRKVAMKRAYYHCSSSCISPRHPYFKPREVTAPPEVARSLTTENIDSIKSYGIDLSFVRS